MNHRKILGEITSTLPVNGQDDRLVVEVSEDASYMEQETDEAASRRRRRDDLPSDIEVEVKYIGWLLEAQRVAAETITNLCSSDDDGGEQFYY